MSEKLSELSKYVCDQCGTEECKSPTRKTFSKEGRNNEGDMIILDFDIYHCCRDDNQSSYCDYCTEVTTPKEKKVLEKPVVTKIVSVIKDGVSQPIEYVKVTLEEKKKALLEKMAKDKKLLEELEE